MAPTRKVVIIGSGPAGLMVVRSVMMILLSLEMPRPGNLWVTGGAQR